MSDYDIVVRILSKVISGKNLNEEFNENIINININISKIKDISYGVMRNYFILNAILDKLVRIKPQQEVSIILLIALYEIKYTKKPEYAITNDMVDLGFKLNKNIKTKNFINAVIRNFLRNRFMLENELINDKQYKYNFPIWIINKIKNDYPNDWNNIIKNSNIKPTISLRINQKKINLNNYVSHLNKENISYNLVDGIINLENTIAVEKIPLFSDGYISIQDKNAQRLNDIINFSNNEYVLDACSAPGGKACQILENNQVKLLALDIDKNRLDKVKQNFNRLDLVATTLCADASKLDWWDNKQFDVIIADVPCSASGTLKRNPDIKVHRQITDINNFVANQRNIILNLWKILKNNGYMIYITCSIFKEENQDNIIFFQKKLDNLKVIKELQLLPDENGDGFYYSVLKKENKNENL